MYSNIKGWVEISVFELPIFDGISCRRQVTNYGIPGFQKIWNLLEKGSITLNSGPRSHLDIGETKPHCRKTVAWLFRTHSHYLMHLFIFSIFMCGLGSLFWKAESILISYSHRVSDIRSSLIDAKIHVVVGSWNPNEYILKISMHQWWRNTEYAIVIYGALLMWIYLTCIAYIEFIEGYYQCYW